MNPPCHWCHSETHCNFECRDTPINDFRQLLDFERQCHVYRNHYPLSHDARLKDWLMNYYIDNPNLVTTFAFANCRDVRNTADHIVDSILFYLSRVDIDEFIPFSTSAAEQEQEEQEQDSSASSSSFEDPPFKLHSIKVAVASKKQKQEQKKHAFLDECSICLETGIPKKCIVTLNCQHQFCKKCVKTGLSTSFNIPKCALCRKNIESFVTFNKKVKKEFDDLFNPQVETSEATAEATAETTAANSLCLARDLHTMYLRVSEHSICPL